MADKKKSETTTKFKVDISELKKGIQDAKRQIRLANAEFKAATSGMDSWGKSADGVSDKLKQLEKVLKAQNTILESYEEQYRRVADEQGESSKGAEELRIKIENQKAAIAKTEKQLQTYSQQLADIKNESSQSKSALSNLSQTISKQEEELAGLKTAYSNAVLEYGETSDEAQDLAKQIATLSGDLSTNKKAMSEATAAADNLDKSLGEVDKSAEAAEGGFTVMKGAIANLIADGVKQLASATVDAMKTVVLETDKTYDNFQAQTGASTSEMKKFKEEINGIYKAGLGESLQDVADAMAEVKQQTKETDPSKLKELTANAIVLRDTFGMDVKESMRAVNMLMEQFGITGEEAYNLISQGAQQGLDKNGDLLDTINEYGVHYKQLGYSADEFFNSLKNGTDAGTFSVDKLGDAMKEFGIRTKDTANTTQEGFSLLGYSAGTSGEQISKTKDEIAKLEKNLKYAKAEQEGFNSKTSDLTKMKNADKVKEYSEQLKTAKENLKAMSKSSKDSSGSIADLQERFVAGGDTAKKATQEVLEKLMKMDDKVTQNQIGVDLFGTMWEDLGIEGVKALMNTNGKLDMTKKSMEELKQIKYDNVATEFSKIGRTLTMDFITPLGEKAIPYVQKFEDFIITHMDETVTTIKTVGTAMAAIFVVNKVAAFTQSILTLQTAYTTLKNSTVATTAAQKALNLVQMANPVGLAIAGVGALAAGFVALANKMSNSTSQWEELTEAEQANKDAVDKSAQSYKELKDATDKSTENAQSQFTYYSQLKNELDGLVDKNGKVKKGQEDRAKFIVSTLNNALGTEIELTKGVVKHYEKEKKAIDELIVSKQAEAVLNANKSEYDAAIQNRTKAFEQLTEAQKNYKNITDQIKKAQEEYNQVNSQSVEEYIRAGGTMESYKIELYEAAEKVEDLKDKQEVQRQTLSKAEDTWIGYNATIKNYEGLSSAIVAGDTKKINKALDNMTKRFVTAEQGNKRTLEAQVANMKKNYSDLQTAVKNGTPGVTKEMVDSAKNMVEKSEKELAKLTPKAKTQGEKAGKAVSDGVKSKTPDAEQAGKAVTKAANKGMKAEDTKKTGAKKGEDFAKGVESKKNSAKTKGKEISKAAKKGLEETKTKESGLNFVKGFTKGINNSSANVDLFSAVNGLAGKAVGWLNKKLDEHSPSKVTEQSGRFFTAGFAIGISKESETVNTAVKKLADKALKTLLTANKNGSYEKQGEKAASDFSSGITKTASSAEKAVTTLINKAINKAKAGTKDKKKKSAFESLGKSMIEAFSSGIDKASKKAVTKMESKLNSLTTKYQEKYDAIKELQSSLEERLKDTGELYTKDDDGNVILSNLSGQTAEIEKFGSNLAKLKGKLSKDLLAEIASMDTEEGLALTNKLLSLSSEEIKAYNDAYTQKLEASKNVAKNYYADQVNTLKTQYTKQVKAELKKLKKDLSTVGQNAVDGFLAAFKGKKVDKTMTEFCNKIIKSIKSKFKIKSPSRVMRDEVGRYLIQGIAVGIENNKDSVKTAMEGVKKDLTQPIDFGVSGIKAKVRSGNQNGINAQSLSNYNNTNYTFNQYNNSPKALNRWDIYRQTNNLLKGVV